jgi:hypothetical protein
MACKPTGIQCLNQPVSAIAFRADPPIFCTIMSMPGRVIGAMMRIVAGAIARIRTGGID